ncbi:hypothetical protein TWF281_010863 [Arthrobotrys megalospora]
MPSGTSRRDSLTRSRDDYVIGWISALPIESAAAVMMLDEEHSNLSNADGDSNIYKLGKIGAHNVVMACVNEAGGTPTSIVATNLMRSFRNVRYILMVGVGGGIPSSEYQIRLGDVVVSEPTGKYPGVVQSDFGKWEEDGFDIMGSLNRPAAGLIRAIGVMKREQLLDRSKIHRFVRHLEGGISAGGIWAYPGREKDPGYRGGIRLRRSHSCRIGRLRQDLEVHDPNPKVHYGIIASGNQVIKNREERNKLSSQLGACCVEMEAFGLMNNFPCLVIRGISDYADGHKSDRWQGYASLTAAAYAKELLIWIPPLDMESTPKMGQQMEQINRRLDKIEGKMHELEQDRSGKIIAYLFGTSAKC